MTSSPAEFILLVGDDPATHRELESAFARTAPHVRLDAVRSCEEIEALRTPGVILLDLMLTHEPPFSVLQWLKAQLRYEGIPVIALGSDVLQQDINEAYALGASACLLKNRDSLDHVAGGIAAYAGLLHRAAGA
jgi:two-component system response regulator